MPDLVKRRVTLTRLTVRMSQAPLLMLLLACALPNMFASTIYFHGNLRTDATVTSCGPLCALGPSDADGDYAQFAAVVDTFTVSTATTMQAITYGYGGGTSLTGAAVAPGGLESYLSLFDSAGNFLASTYGAACAPGGQTYNGFCDDVALDGGTLAPGTYQIALTTYFNMSFAENQGIGNLSDGFTGLGTLNAGENLDYAFDVVLPSDISPVPEPSFMIPAGLALVAMFRFRKSLLRPSPSA